MITLEKKCIVGPIVFLIGLVGRSSKRAESDMHEAPKISGDCIKFVKWRRLLNVMTTKVVILIFTIDVASVVFNRK